MNSKVYFNNACSICKFEIDHYKKISKNIDWIDISTDFKGKKDTKLEPEKLLRRLHVIKKGKLFAGVDAFIEIWSDIPRYKMMSKIIKKPIIYHILWFLYELFALFLFHKNKNQVNKIKEL